MIDSFFHHNNSTLTFHILVEGEDEEEAKVSNLEVSTKEIMKEARQEEFYQS